jgi:hypothetical protein
MLSRCWLHIGTGKTGTTSIQHHLARNRKKLLAQGYLYPVAPGPGNHHALSAFALDDGKIDGARARLGIVDAISLERLRREFPSRLESEIAGKGVPNLILSNEVLAVRLRTAAEIGRLKHLCDRIAANTKVIIYVRNQIDYLVGIYTTAVMDGNPMDFDPIRWARQADYAELLARWTSVFERDDVVVRRYERADFPDGDVRKDFLRQLGIEPATLARTRYLNQSLDAESILFVRALNRRVPIVLAKPLRYLAVAVLSKRRGRKRFAISQTLASQIADTFRASNAQVAAQYFPLMPLALFSPPSCVDADGTDKPLPWNKALRIAATLAPLALFWSCISLTRRTAEKWRSILNCGRLCR